MSEPLERIWRCVSGSAVANERLSLTPQGKVGYALKSAYRDGTTHVIVEPLDFLSRLAALVPKPKVNLTRFHGVLALNAKPIAKVVPEPTREQAHAEDTCTHSAPVRTSWARMLKRVFDIDMER